MKQRLFALLLAVCMVSSLLTVPAAAADTVRFSDVTDQDTAATVETLRLMGVLDGYGDGTFRPDGKLTRAQFCKMVTYMMDGSNELGRYRTVTVFPDVKPSYWAAGYINLAAKGRNIIAGYPDGKFYPERTVTLGQAVTILLRLLGYKDEDVGGVWPDSYVAVGATIGLTDGVGADGNASLTRAQAAKLFVNLLEAQRKESGTLYELGEETELLSVDGGSGILKTGDGKTYTMAHPVASTTLVGTKGRVVLNKGKALTFLPQSASSTGYTDAAVIIYADRSAAGLDALAGNSSYQLYKNGAPATVGDLRKNDVATYHPATNSIRVCDTRVTVYYESCEPNPSAPTKIKVLSGTEFYVLPTARDSVAAFKPGKQMTLLLTADGQVAGAVEPSGISGRGNALGVVSADGTVQMLCGNTMVQLKGKAEAECCGKVVRLSAIKKDALNLSVFTSSVSGDLDITARTLGKQKLAENVMVFQNGERIGLSQLGTGTIKAGDILCARTNWEGNVDLIALGSKNGTVVYGLAVVHETKDESGDVTERIVEVEYGNGLSTGKIETAYAARNGAYVAATLNSAGQFTKIQELTRLKGASSNAWIGKTAVTFGGKTYTVPTDVLCYNADSKEWTTLDKGLAYASTMDLYVIDGVVRVVEVKH